MQLSSRCGWVSDDRNPSMAGGGNVPWHSTPVHMRHWHKYSGGHLDPERRFYFRRDADTPAGVTAGSAGELDHQLRVCDDAVIVHHCQHGDFSRWVADVLGDPPLAAAVAAAERRSAPAPPPRPTHGPA
jgi:hypothetical protein